MDERRSVMCVCVGTVLRCELVGMCTETCGGALVMAGGLIGGMMSIIQSSEMSVIQ